MHLNLNARFTGEPEDVPAYTTLRLDLSETAFLLVDCEYDDSDSGVGHVLEEIIAPTLTAVRKVGMKVVYVCGGSHGDAGAMSTELHGTRRGQQRKRKPWRPQPYTHWNRGMTPHDEDPVIIKNGQNGFRHTSLDFYLRTNAIKNLLCVGFSFKSCLFYTLVGAFEHNYRVVFLRDGTHLPGENEFRDTLDDLLPEKGWVRLVLTRLIEDHLGYSSTCTELQAACAKLDEDRA
ncbi:isochorismatase family protein [Chloroflexi bacterium TSY]|nr:isochorismatase family protein [Chloroflexi bacterium TSY]